MKYINSFIEKLRQLPDSSNKTPPEAAIASYQRFGYIVLLFLVGGIGGWSIFASLQGAVIAPSQITVKANMKVIQHLEGGIVSNILIEEGEAVQKGDVLVRLDKNQRRRKLSCS